MFEAVNELGYVRARVELRPYCRWAILKFGGRQDIGQCAGAAQPLRDCDEHDRDHGQVGTLADLALGF